MKRGAPLWILLSSLFVSPLLLIPCGSSALTSHSYRHHSRGSSRPTRDDPGYNSTSFNPEDLGWTAPPLQTTTPYQMPEVMVRHHHEIRLNCDLATNNSTHATLDGFNPTWIRNGDPVSTYRVESSSLGRRVGVSGHHYTRDSLSGQLHIANVRLEDDGVWQCEDRDTGSARSKPVRLIVLEPPRPPYLVVDGRRLDPGNVFLPVKEGAELSVWCVVEGGHPAPSLAWLLNSADLNTTTDITVHQHSRSEAKLGTVLRAHHNATVTCLVHHVTLANPLNASLLLDVQYSPSFGISRVPGFGFPITEGIQVSLKCDVDSNPTSTPLWVKDNGAPPVAQSSDGFLNFSEIHREHSGWYKCTSHHLLGDFSSIGYFLNVRYEAGLEVTPYPAAEETTSPGRQVEVALGGAVQLQCPVGAASCWSRVGSGGRLEAVGPGPELALDQVLYQEAGEYRCVAGRRLHLDQWKDKHSVQLVVTGRPMVFPSNKTLTVFTGQAVTMAVEFCANPPASRTVWLTTSQLLKPGDTTATFTAHNLTEGSSPHCQLAVLTLRTVSPGDEGEYWFLVRSSRGLAEGVVTLNVTRASSFSISTAKAHYVSTTAILYIFTLLLHRFFIGKVICV